MEFKISKKAAKTTYLMMGLGLLATIIGIAMDDSHEHMRPWANLLVNGFFFFAIALGALFFLALQYAAEVAWSAVLKRVFEGVMGFLPYGAAILIIVFACSSLHLNHLYHWMADGVMEKGNDHYDALIAGKGAYLNQPFFWVRILVYLGTFLLFARTFRKRSLLEDQQGGTALHFTNYRKGGAFLVLFGVFSSTLSWDWLMSIDTHWFSTLYGWYTFSGMWVSALITFHGYHFLSKRKRSFA
jgi:hypothetical protein